MTVELVTILLGFLALAGGQIASVLTLIVRMDRQSKQVNERIDRVNERIDLQAEQTNKRFDNVNKRFDDVNKRFDDVNKRFDDMTREFGDIRERMAKLEGSLDGFLAGRRDRDAA